MEEKVKHCLNVVMKWYEELSSRPLIIGLNGPQGSGKTTIARSLEKNGSVKILALSIDDFYYPSEELAKIYRESGYSWLYEFRGNPGTHDISLLISCLQKIKSGVNTHVMVPTYDKLANESRGERNPTDKWRIVELPIDIVIVEGWLIGFGPTGFINTEEEEMLEKKIDEYQTLNEMLDAFIWWQADDLTSIYEWRYQQESNMAAEAGALGMSRKEVEMFVDKFMPAYKHFNKVNLNCPTEIINIDKNRSFKLLN